MPVQNMAWNFGWTIGNGGVSLQVNFARGLAVAQASLSAADGDGACFGGVTQFSAQPDPNGPVQVTAFSYDTSLSFPPVVFDPNMVSVTAELDTGSNQQGTMTLMVSLWN